MVCPLLELFLIVIAIRLRPLATALIIMHPVQHPSHWQHSYSLAAVSTLVIRYPVESSV